jgi:hypothetical protein
VKKGHREGWPKASLSMLDLSNDVGGASFRCAGRARISNQPVVQPAMRPLDGKLFLPQLNRDV